MTMVHDDDCEADWGAEGQESPCRCAQRAGKCVFCELIEDEKIATEHADGQVYSLTPLKPVVPGHRLFVSYWHRERADEDPHVTGMVFRVASAWAASQESDFNLIVNAGPDAGQTVRHLHVHYVPRRPGDGLLMPWGGVHG